MSKHDPIPYGWYVFRDPIIGVVPGHVCGDNWTIWGETPNQPSADLVRQGYTLMAPLDLQKAANATPDHQS